MTRSILRSAWFRLALLVLVLCGAWFTARSSGVLAQLHIDRLPGLVREVRQFAWAAPVFVVTYALASTLGLPATPLTLTGGAVFGPWLGSLFNWMGATLGATGAFLLARALGGDAVRSLLGTRAAVLDSFAGEQAFGALLRLRLLPIIPFNGINFGAGLAGVRPGPYVLATALGIIPGTIVYTYFADALLAGVDGAREAALLRVGVAGVLLVLLSFIPALAKRVGWLSAAILLGLASPSVDTLQAQVIDRRPSARDVVPTAFPFIHRSIGTSLMRFARSLHLLVLCAAVACSNAEPPTAPNATPAAPDGPLPNGTGVTASFMRTGYNVSGTATLVIDKGVAQLDFSADFAIASTPGPFVYLNTDANPNRGQPLRVAALRSRTGAQRYTFQVPAGVRYTHVIIWCDPFNVGMAQAVLPASP